MSTNKHDMIEMNVPVFLFEDNGFIVAYCPILKLSTYGSDKIDALEAFDDAVNILIEHVKSRGTMEDYLNSHGWVRSSEKYNPPSVEVDKLPLKESTFLMRDVALC